MKILGKLIVIASTSLCCAKIFAVVANGGAYGSPGVQTPGVNPSAGNTSTSVQQNATAPTDPNNPGLQPDAPRGIGVQPDPSSNPGLQPAGQ